MGHFLYLHFFCAFFKETQDYSTTTTPGWNMRCIYLSTYNDSQKASESQLTIQNISRTDQTGEAANCIPGARGTLSFSELWNHLWQLPPAAKLCTRRKSHTQRSSHAAKKTPCQGTEDHFLGITNAYYCWENDLALSLRISWVPPKTLVSMENRKIKHQVFPLASRNKPDTTVVLDLGHSACM